MTEKASGVYLNVTDNSIQTSGAQTMNVVIPMMTVKGELGLNYVTADTLEDVLGYDIKFNSNYYGLRKILESISGAYVWRINSGAFYGNFYGSNEHLVRKTSLADITTNESWKSFGVANKTPGYYAKTGVKFAYKMNEIYVTPETSDDSTTLTFDDTVNMSTVVLYDALNSTPLAKVSNDKLVDIDSSSTVYGTVSGQVITITQESMKTQQFYAHYVINNPTDYVMTVAYGNMGDTFVPEVTIATVEFSKDSESDTYWKNVDFGDYIVSFEGNITNDTWFTLSDGVDTITGSNGSIPNTVDLDVSVLDKVDCNFLAMNGLSASGDGYKFVNRLVPKCEQHKIRILVDAPSWGKYIELLKWRKNIAASEYVILGCRADTTTDDRNRIIYIYPSVYYIQIFARMMANYGNCNYPPAGASYGTIATEKLMDCDYAMYADNMKTERLNWIKDGNLSPMMWEQRTTYALNSDLSYIAPTFIVDSVASEIIAFEENFNFRYMTPTDLMNQSTGLNTILQNYVDSNFLYSYKIKMPTFAEAQKAGRTLVIPIEITVMKDSEVIQINLTLNNA